MPRTLFILNDPPYGTERRTERSYNALRLAGSLARRDGEDVQVFSGQSGRWCSSKGPGARG